MAENRLEIRIEVEGRDAQQVLSGVSRELRKLDGSAKEGARGMAQLSRSSRAAERDLERLSRTAANLKRMFALAFGALAAYGVSRMAADVAHLADEYQLLSARLRLVSSSAEELRRIQEGLYQVAQRTRADLGATVEVYARLANATREFGVSSQELLRVVETLNNAILVSGASTQEAQAALLQLSQAMASGRLQGDELRSVLEQMPILGRAIAREMGVTIGQLRELGSQGQITTQIILQALSHMYDELAAKAAAIPMTVGQSFQVLRNAWQRLIGESQQLGGAFDVVKAAALALAQTLDQIRTGELSADWEQLGWIGVQAFKGLTNSVYVLAEGFLYLDRVWNLLKLAFFKLEEVIAAGLSRILQEVLSVLETVNANRIGDWAIPDSLIASLQETASYLSEWQGKYTQQINETEKTLAEIEEREKALKGIFDALDKNFEKTLQNLRNARKEGKAAFNETGNAANAASNNIKVLNAELERQQEIAQASRELEEIFRALYLETLPEGARAIQEIRDKYTALIAQAAGLASITGEWEKYNEIVKLALDLQDKEIAALQEKENVHETVAGEITQIWQHTYERLTDIVADWIYELDINLKSVVDLFRRAAAQVAATWVMTGFQGIFSPTLAGAPGVMGTAQAAGGSTFLPTAPGLSSFLQAGTQGLYNFFTTPETLTFKAAEMFPDSFLVDVHDFFAGPVGTAAGAGLMSGLTTYLATGDVKQSVLAGIGSTAGWAIGNAIAPGVGGPVGALLGGIGGGLLGSVFGDKKAPRVTFSADLVVDFVPGKGFQLADVQLDTKRKYGAGTQYEQQVRETVNEYLNQPVEWLNELYQDVVADLPEEARWRLDQAFADIDFEAELSQRTHESLGGDIDTRPLQRYVQKLLLSYEKPFEQAFAEELKRGEALFERVSPYLPEDAKRLILSYVEALFPDDVFDELRNVPIEKLGSADFGKWLEENIKPFFASIEEWEAFYDWAMSYLEDFARKLDWRTAETADFLQSEWDKILFNLRDFNFGASFMDLMNQEIERAMREGDRPDFSKVAQQWSLDIKDSIKSAILDQAFGNIMAGAQEYLLEYLAGSVFQGGFTFENIDKTLQTIESFDFTQFTSLMTDIFGSWQTGREVDWEALRQQYGNLVDLVEQWLQKQTREEDLVELQQQASTSLLEASTTLKEVASSLAQAAARLGENISINVEIPVQEVGTA